MRAWEILKPFWGWIMVAAGLLMVAFFAAAYRDIQEHKRGGRSKESRFPQGFRETDYGIPWTLRLLYTVSLLAALFYVLWMAQSGHSY